MLPLAGPVRDAGPMTAERMIIVWRRQQGAVLVPDGLDVPGGMAGLPLIQNGRTVAEVEPAELASCSPTIVVVPPSRAMYRIA